MAGRPVSSSTSSRRCGHAWRDQVGGGVGVAAGTLHPDLPGAQRRPEGEQDAQLPVVLEGVLVAGGPGRRQVGLPAGRDEAHRGVCRERGGGPRRSLSAAARRRSGFRWATRWPRSSAAPSTCGANERTWAVAGLHQLKVAAITGRALVVARGAAASRSSPRPRSRPDGGVVEVAVQSDVEDLVEQLQAARRSARPSPVWRSSDPVTGATVGDGQGLVEHLHQLVDDARCGLQRGRPAGWGGVARAPSAATPWASTAGPASASWRRRSGGMAERSSRSAPSSRM